MPVHAQQAFAVHLAAAQMALRHKSLLPVSDKGRGVAASLYGLSTVLHCYAWGGLPTGAVDAAATLPRRCFQASLLASVAAVRAMAAWGYSRWWSTLPHA
eukprot:366519-Chlamydomonas_euryale.AAC.1